MSEVTSSPSQEQNNIDGNSKKFSDLKRVYELAITTRNFEITNLIHRNNFYMLFQGVLLAAVFSNQASKPYVEFIICLCGVIVSWFQIQVSAGAKYWQEYWEKKVDDIEEKLKVAVGSSDFIPLFGLVTQDDEFKLNLARDIANKNYNCLTKWFILKKPSVSVLPVNTAIILSLTWVVLLIQTLDFTSFKQFVDIKLNLIDGLYFVPQKP
jgi:hypothetical protein